MQEAPIFKDLVVLELASVLAGPSVGMFFAELGARVIKVEHFAKGGDVTRSWKLTSEDADTDISAYFSSVNWGKASIGLDLRGEAGRSVLYDLAASSDVVLASYKPGDAQKLGVDADSLRQLNPALIYAEISAFGQADPRPGFDAIIQAESGFTYMNGPEGGPPIKMPVALMDVLAAHHLKEAILIALYQRLKSGEGASLHVPLFRAGLASLVNQGTNWLVAGKIPVPMGSGHPNICPYGDSFSCADGKAIVLAVGNDAQFKRLCACLDAQDLAVHPDYQSNPLRVRHREALLKALQTYFSRETRDTLLGRLIEANVPAGAIRDMQEVFELPEAAPQLLEAPAIRGISGIAFEGAGSRVNELPPPPRMGADTFDLLRDFLGYPEEKIRQLEASKEVYGR